MSLMGRRFAVAVLMGVALAYPLATPVSAGNACETPCIHVPCEGECWSVRIHYRRDGIQQVGDDGTFWGSISGATCRADEIADHGFWIAEWEHPTKIPASMIELVVIDRAVARAAGEK